MQTAQSRAEVTVYSPLFTPFRQPLQGPTVSIGRASDCSIPIKDRYLSRRHAEIIASDGAWVLKDLGSANGTYLNGTRVERDHPLKPGDRIRLGDTEIVFETPEAQTDRQLAVKEQHVSATIAIPIHDIDHVPSRDRTDTADAVARLQTLNLISRELIEDRPMDTLFGFMVERIMKHLRPSRAAIALLAEDGRSFAKVEVRREDENDKSELTISHTVLAEVVEEKKALAFLDISADEKLSRAQSIVMQGIHSILCAPMTIGHDVVGVLYVDYRFGSRSISEEDVRLVAQIARFAAIKLETTRLREDGIQKRIMDEELRTASAIQRRLLPPAPSGIPGFTFLGTNQPCRTVSGDYYDFVVRPNGKVYFVIADVSGKGVTAGLMMAGLQVAFRIFTKTDPDPSVLVTQLNEALRENLPRSKFVTLFLGRLDVNSGFIEYVNAGHTPPLWIRKDTVEEMSDSDILLGVVSNAVFRTQNMQLERGDALVLFTDGVSEAQNEDGTELGVVTLQRALGELHSSNADTLGYAVAATVIGHVGDSEALGDDVTMVVVSRDVE